jgi:hypothetical protein
MSITIACAVDESSLARERACDARERRARERGPLFECARRHTSSHTPAAAELDAAPGAGKREMKTA